MSFQQDHKLFMLFVHREVFVILNFKLSPCSECFIPFLGDSPASELYMPKVWNILLCIHRRCKQEAAYTAYEDGTESSETSAHKNSEAGESPKRKNTNS